MHVAIEAVEPGMELAADIKDAGGRLLLPAGTAVTEKHIRYFQMWGILQVEIVTDQAAVDAQPAIDPALLAQARTTVAPRFVHVDRDHPAMVVLFDYCAMALLRKAH